MLTLPLPEVINGGILTEQLEEAGLPSMVYTAGDELVFSDLDESDEPAVARLMAEHSVRVQAQRDGAAVERSNETTVRQRAADALAANQTFLALTTPTNTQTLAQVKALTRQQNALIRLVLRRFDSTTGL